MTRLTTVPTVPAIPTIPAITTTVTIPAALRDLQLEDIGMPAPMLLLPLRLEYRVIEANAPLELSGRIAEMIRTDAGVVLDRSAIVQPPPFLRGLRPWTIGKTRTTFRAGKQIWFRWYPDDDFTLKGVAPASVPEKAALADFDAATSGRAWHLLDDPVVVSAWQALSRAVAPERALHLLRNRGRAEDANFIDKLGTIALLPEKVALYALDAGGAPTLLGEGAPIDPSLKYSIANLKEGGWHTDFDGAVRAGMGLRLSSANAVDQALGASWIVAVGLSKSDGAAAMTALLSDSIANGNFAFLAQDTPTNNTPDEPTPYQSPRTDLVAFLRTAADAEEGVLASPLTQSAEIFAEAIGVDVAEVARAPLSGDLAFEDARAMLRVVGPALIDIAVESTAAIKSLDEEEVIEFFAESIAARGAIPPVRFGKNPYGVLPVVDLAALAPLASDQAHEQTIENFVRDFARIMVGLAGTASSSVPIIAPGDPEAAQKLEEILKTHPVSRRIEVRNAGAGVDSESLGCPYVTSKAHPPQDYLADLARLPIGALPDPTDDDATWPLLYRLARLTLTKVTIFKAASKATGTAGLKVNTRTHLDKDEQARVDAGTKSVGEMTLRNLVGDRRNVTIDRSVIVTSRRYLEALTHLGTIAAEPGGDAKLETLLMECVDLFQHRIDAWSTGIAYRRLIRRRRAGRKGLVGGYWGMLGKLRPASVTGRSDGYLRAPSQHQAATLALLRAAHLRHRDSGAFDISLDSARVRKALRLLEVLQAGISPGEALGYLGERRLHDRKQDLLIFVLREHFPLRNPDDDKDVEIRLFDGLAFLDANLGNLGPPPLTAADLASLRKLQAELLEEFDALADLVIAEATHLRAMGQADAANAWLQVLSGETVPGMPTVIRTRRRGQGSSHRVAVLIDPVDPSAHATPRAIAEPSFAALVKSEMPNHAAATVTLVMDASTGPGQKKKNVTLGELGLEPIDLLVGGRSEVVLRAKHWLVTHWSADLGALPDRDLVSHLNRKRELTVDIPAATQKLLNLAEELRRAVTQGRALEPGDLSAAADPSRVITDDIERTLVNASAAKLAARATMLASRIAADGAALAAATGPVVAAARNHARLVSAGATDTEVALAMTRITQLRVALDAALLKVSFLAEPSALRLMTSAAIAAAPDDLEQSMRAIADRLAARQSTLTAAAAAAAAAVTDAASANQRKDALVAALRKSLDGDALPILPPFARTPETTPLLEPDAARMIDPLASWAPRRDKVKRALAHFGAAPWKEHRTPAASTGADATTFDTRPESEAPRTIFFGRFLSQKKPDAVSTFVGFVADEWAEQRPSATQQTGVAINYDAPQSEPPHALLLAEPTSNAAWSLDAAAKIVSQTIALMKTRAVVAQERPMPGTLLPHANQVPAKLVKNKVAARIPTQRLQVVAGLNSVFDGEFVVRQGSRNVGVDGVGLSETSGFGKVKD